MISYKNGTQIILTELLHSFLHVPYHQSYGQQYFITKLHQQIKPSPGNTGMSSRLKQQYFLFIYIYFFLFCNNQIMKHNRINLTLSLLI